MAAAHTRFLACESHLHVEKYVCTHIVTVYARCWLLTGELSQDPEDLNYDARYGNKLEDRICNWRQHVGEYATGSRKSVQKKERDNLHGIFLIGTVLLIYLTIKLSTFVGILQLTFVQRWRVCLLL